MRDLKQETILLFDILVFMSSWNFMLIWVEHEKSFITEGPEEIADVKSCDRREKG